MKNGYRHVTTPRCYFCHDEWQTISYVPHPKLASQDNDHVSPKIGINVCKSCKAKIYKLRFRCKTIEALHDVLGIKYCKKLRDEVIHPDCKSKSCIYCGNDAMNRRDKFKEHGTKYVVPCCKRCYDSLYYWTKGHESLLERKQIIVARRGEVQPSPCI